MTNLIFSFNAIAPLFFMVALGYYLKKKKVAGQNFFDTVTDFSFNYLFPFIMFRQIYTMDIAANINSTFIFYGTGVLVVLVILLLICCPLVIKERPTCGAFIQGSFRSNSVLMAVALSLIVFGEEGSGPTVMLLPFITILYNLIAVIVLTLMSSENKELDIEGIAIKIIKNPLIIGAVAGLAVSLLNIELPSFMVSVVDDLASMATPLALIALGGQLELDTLFARPALLFSATFIKLIIAPLAAVVPALLFFDFTRNEIGALLFIFSAPTAVSSYPMAKAMKCDSDLAGRIIMYSTVLSAFTIFLWLYLFKTLNYI